MADPGRHTSTSDTVGKQTTWQEQDGSHKVFTCLEQRELNVVNIHFLGRGSGLACDHLLGRIVRGFTFLIVLFIALVTPELQCEPKLIHAIRATANRRAFKGGGLFPFLESDAVTTFASMAWVSSDRGSDTSCKADLVNSSLLAMFGPGCRYLAELFASKNM